MFGRRKKQKARSSAESALVCAEEKLDRLQDTKANIRECIGRRNPSAALIAACNSTYSYTVTSKMAEASVAHNQGNVRKCQDKLLEASVHAHNEEESIIDRVKRLRAELAAL